MTHRSTTKSPARSGCMMRSADCMAATNTVIARHAYGRICRGHHLALSKTRTVNRSLSVDACLTACAVDTLLCPRIRGFVSFCVLPDDTLRHRGAWFCRAGRLCCDPLKLRHSGPGLGYEVCVADHGRSWAINAGESHRRSLAKASVVGRIDSLSCTACRAVDNVRDIVPRSCEHGRYAADLAGCGCPGSAPFP